jgi:lysophospholipase L1-like esterase
MSGSRQWIFMILAVIIEATCCEAQIKVPRAAFIPEINADASWMRRVAEQQGVLTNQPCRVCFMGDSLTEFWLHTGRATWDGEFAPLKAINLGLTGDRTEHILYRIQKLEFWRAKPQLVVLLMGTNNLGREVPDKPEDVVRAIAAGVTMLRAKIPQASILVLTIPPSGDEPESALRQRIKQTNALLLQMKWPDRVRLLAIYDAMVDERDRWREGLTLDGTHFSAAGYAKLAGLILPVAAETLPDVSTNGKSLKPK